MIFKSCPPRHKKKRVPAKGENAFLF
jgi:hypothetical protein